MYIVLCGVVLVSSMMNNIVNNGTRIIGLKHDKQIINYVGSDVNVLKKFREQYIVKEEIIPKDKIFKVTAYDLSVQSTNKSRGNLGFGITKDGTNLKGENWMSARVIAVDPRVIPLGSNVLIEFVDVKYKKCDNVYTARDIGGDIKGREIDIFFGDFYSQKQSKKVINFGVTTASVTILD